MVEQFAQRFGLEPDQLGAEELREAESRVAEKFGTRDWIYALP
jgi:lipoate-protein ligase A